MRVLYLDCFSGISGDMTVGALCDLGVKPSAFEWELGKLEIGDFHAHWERQARQNIDGVKFSIHEGATHTHGQDEPEEEEHGHHHQHGHEHEEEHEREEEHGHEHDHREHGHEHAHHHHEEEHGSHEHGRNFREIRALIEESALSDFVKKHAVGIFARIATAEGKIHGTKPEDAEFHEVGALDSIADIVLACVGIELLGVERVIVSPLAEGHGWIDVAHGRFPIPAPATLEILAGLSLGQIDEPFEFITPTGAAIAAEFAHSFARMPAMTVEKIGYGVGSRKLANRPNVLRAVLGEIETVSSSGGYEQDRIVRIETNIDDLSPEIVGAVTGQLLQAGALDVFLTPIQMKKNRPGVQLTALCEEAAVPKIADLIFRQTTSFGLRMDHVDRLKLARTFETVETPHGSIKVKIGSSRGETLQIAPEYESCREVSEKSGQPLRAVYEAALRARGR